MGGSNRIKFNTREKLISQDFNDAQTVEATSRLDVVRRIAQRVGTQFDSWSSGIGSSAAVALPTISKGTVHDCFGGLMVRPDAADHLLVDAGVAGFFTTGLADAGESPYVTVASEGVTSSSVLTFTTNASGSPRIDIVECRVVESVTSTQSRDIYNATTRQFTPATVDKRIEVALEFRIRLGTPNAGFPAIQAEWMPLAFVVVQSGSSGFNQSDVYDVRPLVSERSSISSPSASGAAAIPIGLIYDRSIVPQTTSGFQMSGYWRGSFFGYEVGGKIQRSTPSSISDFGNTSATGGDPPGVLEVGSSDSRITSGASAISLTNGQLNHLIAYFPQGLGRCVRYSQNPNPTGDRTDTQQIKTGRLPNGPNGILMIGRAARVGATNGCIVESLPSVLGNVSIQDQGVIVGWLIADGTNLIPCYHNRGRVTIPLNSSGNAWGYRSWTLTGVPGAGGLASVANTVFRPTAAPNNATNALMYPPTARSVFVSTVVTVFNATGVTAATQISQQFPDSASYSLRTGNWFSLPETPGSSPLTFTTVDEFDVSGPQVGNQEPAATGSSLTRNLNAISGAFTNAAIDSRVEGWTEF